MRQRTRSAIMPRLLLRFVARDSPPSPFETKSLLQNPLNRLRDHHVQAVG
jgi:hypothetical protein